jgi:hypothetical protein
VGLKGAKIVVEEEVFSLIIYSFFLIINHNLVQENRAVFSCADLFQLTSCINRS